MARRWKRHDRNVRRGEHTRARTRRAQEPTPWSERTQRRGRERDYTVPSIAAAMRILWWLMDRRATLSEISASLALSKSTAYAILKTLQGGFVSYNGATKRYFLGVELLGLGEAAARQLDHVETVKPFLRSLAEETNLTGIMAQRINDHLVVVHKEEGRTEIRATMSLGQVVPAGVGAMGKAFAAFAHREIGSGDGGSIAIAGVENAAPPKVLAALEEVRRCGYAASRGEYRLGVNAVAAPVFDYRGQLALVLCLIGFAASMSPEKLASYGGLLKTRCAEASRILGNHDRRSRDAGDVGREVLNR